MNEISIMYSSEGFEVSLKSDTLDLEVLEGKALALISRLQGDPLKPEGYHS